MVRWTPERRWPVWKRHLPPIPEKPRAGPGPGSGGRRPEGGSADEANRDGQDGRSALRCDTIRDGIGHGDKKLRIVVGTNRQRRPFGIEHAKAKPEIGG